MSPESKWYRIYFFNSRGILGRHSVTVENDTEAIFTAYALYRSCSDVATHFDVWEGQRLVFTMNKRQLQQVNYPSWRELAAAKIEAIIEFEAHQRRTGTEIAASRLLERVLKKVSD